ncbi:hypothetical protein ACFLZJ_01085 [Nanoarchaeota archaeon]
MGKDYYILQTLSGDGSENEWEYIFMDLSGENPKVIFHVNVENPITPENSRLIALSENNFNLALEEQKAPYDAQARKNKES